MSGIVEKLILPIAIGVAVALIVKMVTGENLGKRGLLCVLVVVALLAMVLVTLIPPYIVKDVAWQSGGGTLDVTGRLARTITGISVPNESVQVSIFEAGRNDPVAGPKFANTANDGRFNAKFPPSSVAPDKNYLINVGYKHRTVFAKEGWVFDDFNVSDPPAMRSVQSAAQTATATPAVAAVPAASTGAPGKIALNILRPADKSKVSQFVEVAYSIDGAIPSGARAILVVRDPLGDYWSWGSPPNGKHPRVQIGKPGDVGKDFEIGVLVTTGDFPRDEARQDLPATLAYRSITVTRE